MDNRTTPTRRGFSWTGIVLTFGLLLRLVHYLRNPSVWHDEAVLLINVLGKSFGALLGHLDYHEAAPPLFLWLERLVALSLGDSTYALRLPAFLASCATLLLIAWVAKRLLPATAVPWAVLLFACSDRLLWHACEAKPYAIDALAAVALLALHLHLREKPLPRQCLVFALLAPPVLWLCFPGCFLYGAVLVALLPALWHDRRPAAWLSYSALVLTVFVSFGLLVAGPIHAQRHEMMDACWTGQFPDWSRPWSTPAWMVFSTFDVVRYCLGHTGHALALLAIAGAAILWRRGERPVVVMLTLPLGLALVASCLHAYPYGGARVEAYAAPALALLVAAAVPAVGTWLWARARLGVVVLGLLLLEPAAMSMIRLVSPWPRAECDQAAEFVMRQHRPGEVVAGNHWEHIYYFRHLGPAFRSLESSPITDASGRIWVVVTGATRPEQRRVIDSLPTDWRPIQRCEFQWTTVYLYEK